MTALWVPLFWKSSGNTLIITALFSSFFFSFLNIHAVWNCVCFFFWQTTFISALMVGINLLKTTPALVSNDTANRIINCSSGILKLSLNECPDENPAPPVSSSNYITYITKWSLYWCGSHTWMVLLSFPSPVSVWGRNSGDRGRFCAAGWPRPTEFCPEAPAGHHLSDHVGILF